MLSQEMAANKSEQYPMTMKKRNHAHIVKQEREYYKSDPDLKNYDPFICKTIQWTFCLIFTFALILMTYFIAFSSLKNQSLSAHSPSCSKLNGQLSSLKDGNLFNDLMHTRFIPFILMPTNAEKTNEKIQKWEGSIHQKMIKIALIIDKRKEFEFVLKEEWDQSMKRGVFAYSIDNLPHRKLHSNHSQNPYNTAFEIMYNPQRKLSKSTKSKKEKIAISVKQEWNENAFNFYKANGDNLMFVIDDEFIDLDEAKDAMSDIFSCYNSENGQNRDWNKKHLVLTNKFPIGSYSGLFVPFFGSHSTQTLSLESIQRAIAFSNMFYSDSMRIGFNGMSAMASVNMLHFQFWEKKGTKLPIEVLSDYLSARNIAILYSGKDLIIRQIIGYPVDGFIFEPRQKMIQNGIDSDIFGNALFHCVDYLIRNDVPHSLMINRSKIFLFVRKTQKASKLSIYYGFTECSGWITVLNEDIYKNITMDELWMDFVETVAIEDEEKWTKIKNHCSAFD